ncbi:hypothetical protein C8Q70DRAFT_944258 [Cubamyces menziesii]|nr:hypothetical protein C8Q70DRAFT_944258 [Cubamyces menziesii]
MPMDGGGTKPTKLGWSGSGAWNTPLPFTESTSQTFGFDAKDVKSRYPRLAYDLENVVLGPMPVREFMQTFLPVSAEVLEKRPSHLHAFDGIGNIGKESDIYEPLVKALNADPNPATQRAGRCPNFAFRITANHPDTSGGKVGALKPDVLCYATKHLTEAELKRTNFQSQADMGFAASFIEIKPQASSDHYNDPADKADKNAHRFTLGRQATRNTLSSGYEKVEGDFGQNVAYAVEIFARQHRCFCISVSISGHTARLIRWDRSGAIVSTAFNYVTHPELLCEFYWRFGSVTDEARGYDLTVVPATSAEETLFLDTVTAHIKTQVDVSRPRTLSKCLEVHYLKSHVTAVQIPPSDSSVRLRRFLVSRPVSFPRTIAGSGTRAYWAVEVEDAAAGAQSAVRGRICFLKDSWRLVSTGAETCEGDVLRELKAKKVPNIPSPSFDGDVFDAARADQQSSHTTITGDFLDSGWVCQSSIIRQYVHRRTHYRLVLDVVGFDLLHLRGTHELLHGAYNAFEAYQGAYKLANRLHRDIHPGNIILFNEPDTKTPLSFTSRKGYLVDWDHSCVVDGAQHKSTTYMPSLQWQFASESLLEIHRPQTRYHEPSDDLESMLYTVLYCGVLRIGHDMTYDKLVKWLNGMFDESSVTYSGGYSGGKGKRANKERRAYTQGVAWKCQQLKTWIDTLCDYLHPLPETPQARRGKWTMEHVQEFWKTFLQTSHLDQTNRHDHIAKESSKLMRHAPKPALESPIQPTISSGSKRMAPDSGAVEDMDASRPSKLRRKDGQSGSHSGRVQDASRSSSPLRPRHARGRSGSVVRRTMASAMSIATFPPSSVASVAPSIAGPSRIRDVRAWHPTGEPPNHSALSVPQSSRGAQVVGATQRPVDRGDIEPSGEVTAKQMCLMAYRAQHQSAAITDKGFMAYWEQLHPAMREHFEEAARKKNMQTMRVSR